MELTPRDTEILRVVHRHRFLRSPQVAALLRQSHQPILRRLQKLYHHGYLDRPACQLDYYQRAGSRSMVHGLASRGAAYLQRIGEATYPATHQKVGRLFLDHALMISDIMVALTIACRELPNIQLVREKDMAALPSKRREAYRWRVTLPNLGEIGVVPDAMFAVSDHRQQVLVCLEADCGTMPVVSKNLQRSSLSRKLAAYEASWRAGIFRERFDAPRVRVLTVTTCEQRLASLTTCASKHQNGLFHSITLSQVLSTPSELLSALLDSVLSVRTAPA
jgi:hypothetical protein